MAHRKDKPSVSRTVDARRYTAEFRLFSENALYMRRTNRVSAPTVTLDVYGDYWTFFIGTHPRHGAVRAFHEGKKIALTGHTATFIPPFSVIEWCMEPVTFSFHAVMGASPCPEDLPPWPVNFPVDEPVVPESVEAIFEFVRSHRQQFVPLCRYRSPSAVAQRAKNAIDESFREDLRLTDIAASLRFRHETVSRAFKRAYGLSPVQYRNRLRVCESARKLLVESRPVARAALDAGFNDLSRFYRQFHRQMDVSPSRFCRDPER